MCLVQSTCKKYWPYLSTNVHGNKDFCDNVDNIVQIQNSGNFKPDFFLKPVLANIFDLANRICEV